MPDSLEEKKLTDTAVLFFAASDQAPPESLERCLKIQSLHPKRANAIIMQAANEALDAEAIG